MSCAARYSETTSLEFILNPFKFFFTNYIAKIAPYSPTNIPHLETQIRSPTIFAHPMFRYRNRLLDRTIPLLYQTACLHAHTLSHSAWTSRVFRARVPFFINARHPHPVYNDPRCVTCSFALHARRAIQSCIVKPFVNTPAILFRAFRIERDARRVSDAHASQYVLTPPATWVAASPHGLTAAQ
jgi:hypothetical protein